MEPHPEFTPVKIRGKRRGTSAEKWKTGKRRKPELQRRIKPTGNSSASSQIPSTGSRKRRRRDFESALERLPAEVLQQIFEYSGNIEMPTVSRQLALKLSKSQHLHNELASRLLEPVLGISDDESAPTSDHKSALRVLNSRFFTFDFFTTWLKSQVSDATLERATSAESGDVDWQQIWQSLQPSNDLLPPKKLLLPPFDDAGKVSFLAILAANAPDMNAIDPEYVENAYEGLTAAVQTGHVRVVSLLLGIGLRPSTELLRRAVESGCDEDVVRVLVEHPSSLEPDASHGDSTIDLLDVAVWNWADRARRNHNEKGEWLMQLLRDVQGRREAVRNNDSRL